MKMTVSQLIPFARFLITCSLYISDFHFLTSYTPSISCLHGVGANVSYKFNNTRENLSRPCDNTHRQKARFRLTNHYSRSISGLTHRPRGDVWLVFLLCRQV